MSNTEQRMSPLSAGWAEHHADECSFILVSPIDVSHAHDEKELVDDYIRKDKPYLAFQAYRKVDFDTVVKSPGPGPWIGLAGLHHKAITCDNIEDVIKWFPILSKSSEQKMRLYEAIDIKPQVQAVYDERDRKAAEERKRRAERKRGEDIAKVLRVVRSGNDNIEDIVEYTYLSTTTVEGIVQELIAQGKLEIVDFQPPVQKLIKLKQEPT